jgi:DUF4097 and DUF4098 domain-containing protein YvlB
MKTYIIVSIGLILVGLILFTVVMFVNHWDFSKLSTIKYVDNTHSVQESFSRISIETSTADIRFVPSDTQDCQVILHEQENLRHRVLVEEGCLTIHLEHSRHWYDYIGINFSTPKITVALPQQEYNSLIIKGSTGKVDVPKDFRFQSADIHVTTGDVTYQASTTDSLNIKVSTGDISAENLSAGDVSLQVTTGDARVSHLSCRSLTSKGSTGDVLLQDVMVTENLSVTRTTGDIKLTKCDAQSLSINTNTGDITGTLLTDKVFQAQTSTGKVKVPQTATGGICQVTTTTGDITFQIAD